MSGLIYALALFGCSDDATFCERLSDKAQSHETRAACEMELVTALESNLSLRADYPTVIAKCMPKGSLLALGKGPVDLSGREVRLAARETNGGA